MPKEKVLEVIKMCIENNIFCNVYTENTIFAQSLNYNILFYYNENQRRLGKRKINISIVNDLYEHINKYEKEDLLKITVCDENKVIFENIMNKLKQIENVDVLNVEHISRKVIKQDMEDIELAYFYTEIGNEGANKWNAIKELIKKINIKEEEVIAIGDNINDEEMIKNADIGIAMGNSSEAIKKVSNFVTESNDESGVAKVIRKHIR